MPGHDSRVAEIRNQIANELLSRKHQVKASPAINRGKSRFIVVTTKLVEHLSTNPEEEVAKDSVTTLHIRSLDGKATLVLKMWTADTVCDVYVALERHLESGDDIGTQFSLYMQYPRRVLTKSQDGTSTLQQIGLVPRAMLRMVRARAPSSNTTGSPNSGSIKPSSNSAAVSAAKNADGSRTTTPSQTEGPLSAISTDTVDLPRGSAVNVARGSATTGKGSEQSYYERE